VANLEVHDDRPYDDLTISFEEPAPNLADGGIVERTLVLRFGEHDEIEVDCRFEMATNLTLANPPTVNEHILAAPATPTPTRNRPIPTATVTPTATPKALYKVLTPPRPTKTPTQPTAGSGNGGAPNKKPATVVASQPTVVTRNVGPPPNQKAPIIVPSPGPAPKHFGQ
jgi:hypothetical protein